MKTHDLIKSFPPILVRLLARHKGGGPLSDQGISMLCGLEIHLVRYISQQTSWESVNLVHAYDFCLGCMLSLDDAVAWRRVTDYLRKRPTFRYLRTSTEWQTLYAPMLKRWLNASQQPRPDMHPHVRALITRLNRP